MLKIKSLKFYIFFAFFVITFNASASFSNSVAQSSTSNTSVTELGEWTYKCEKPAQSTSEQCALVQSVQSDKNAAISITVIVVKSPDNQFLMRTLAPMGVLLTSELGLMIDELNVGKVPFIRCLTTGCVAEAILNPDLLGKLQNGKIAYFIIAQTPQQSFALPIQLKGLTEGLNVMKAKLS